MEGEVVPLEPEERQHRHEQSQEGEDYQYTKELFTAQTSIYNYAQYIRKVKYLSKLLLYTLYQRNLKRKFGDRRSAGLFRSFDKAKEYFGS